MEKGREPGLTPANNPNLLPSSHHILPLPVTMTIDADLHIDHRGYHDATINQMHDHQDRPPPLSPVAFTFSRRRSSRSGVIQVELRHASFQEEHRQAHPGNRDRRIEYSNYDFDPMAMTTTKIARPLPWQIR